uniref:Uncharacterized protein n=1 Tax=Anguilla anguilla TaxID=7936 RepID=A0A0E9UVB7_ANGAN
MLLKILFSMFIKNF